MNKRINTVVTLSFKKKPVADLFHLTFRYFKQMLLTYSEARQYKKKKKRNRKRLRWNILAKERVIFFKKKTTTTHPLLSTVWDSTFYGLAHSAKNFIFGALPKILIQEYNAQTQVDAPEFLFHMIPRTAKFP